MKAELVSIIMPTFNSSLYVHKALDAILAQTYQLWELVITDDCSTDDTLLILKRYSNQDSRIKVYQLKQNMGGGVARNNSILKSKGRYLAFCDSDDIWNPEKLQKQILFMNKCKCTISFTSYLLSSEQGENKGLIRALPKVTYKHELFDNALGCSTVIYDTQKYGKIFFSEIRKRQDWAFMLRVLKKTQFALGMSEALVTYTLRKKSVSSNKLNLIKYNIAIYNNELGFNIIISYLIFLFCFMPYFLCKVVRRMIK